MYKLRDKNKMKQITKFTLILIVIFLAAIGFEAIMPTPKVVSTEVIKSHENHEIKKEVIPENNFNKQKGVILNSAYKLISEKKDSEALVILEKYEFTKDKDVLQAIIEIRTRKLVADLSKTKSDEDSKVIMMEIDKLKAKSVEINSSGYKYIGL
jgi:hypothetical protein